MFSFRKTLLLCFHFPYFFVHFNGWSSIVVIIAERSYFKVFPFLSLALFYECCWYINERDCIGRTVYIRILFFYFLPLPFNSYYRVYLIREVFFYAILVGRFHFKFFFMCFTMFSLSSKSFSLMYPAYRRMSEAYFLFFFVNGLLLQNQ